MKSIIKRIALALMAMLMLMMSVFSASRKVEAATTYNNTISASLSCSIDSSGQLSAVLAATGYSSLAKKISVELYIEKRILGLFWKRVNIGYTDNVWQDSVTGYYYSNTFTHNLSSGGTYRVTVTYTVSGTGGPDDIIVKTATAPY
ncbi:MAG: hypothetical protein II155_00985 [Clostridia bacterium]|nr:hypothetical protein [Clostridia bacterium]